MQWLRRAVQALPRGLEQMIVAIDGGRLGPNVFGIGAAIVHCELNLRAFSRDGRLVFNAARGLRDDPASAAGAADGMGATNG